MLDSQTHLETPQSPAKAGDLSTVDRVQELKQLTQISKPDSQAQASTASLDNLNTADLYAQTSSAAGGARVESQRSAAPVSAEQTTVTEQKATDPKATDQQPPGQAVASDTTTGAGHERPPAGNPSTESQHTIKPGDTLEGIARQKLGPQAGEDEVQRYGFVTAELNKITDPTKLRPGDELHLPGYDKQGDLTFTNPNNKDIHGSYHKDGTIEIQNNSNGTSLTRKPLDEYGSYQEHDKGPKPEDNYDQTYINKEHYTLTSRKDADGNTETIGSDGFRKVTDKDGNWTATAAPTQDPATSSYDKASGVTTEKFTDGSTIKLFEKDNHSEATDPDGTKTTKWADGSVKVEKTDAQGQESGYKRLPDGHGGYSEHGWGPQPKDNYDETFSAKSGTTTRIEGKDTAEETKTTRLSNGTIKVESKDGNNYQRNPDGSEHHWGKENYDKPAYDYKRDAQLNQSRENLTKAVGDHIPADKQAAFQKDMTAFEERARKAHLSPEEVSKTYDQISKMLNTPEKDAVVSGANRSLLAEGLIHQAAHPGDTDQGIHNTCNVTAVLKRTLARNPSKAAEMAATTAITGQWTAADGHVAKIDKESLQPQAEESVYPPAASGDRSYATQVLNLAMVNDALQRRPEAESYVQRTPDRSNPDDTGERRLDAGQNVISAKQYDAGKDTWREAPDSSPGLTDREVAQASARLNGTSHEISVDDAAGGVESITSERALAHKLHQLQQQGEYPVTLAVDGHHTPIQVLDNQTPSYGAHFVTIDDYDAKTGRVHVSNQWGKESNRWVSLRALYENASGKRASDQDGVDLSDYR